ncbi:MAG: hypothetical protein V4612_02100 [Pseudomonadota bacterium]
MTKTTSQSAANKALIASIRSKIRESSLSSAIKSDLEDSVNLIYRYGTRTEKALINLALGDNHIKAIKDLGKAIDQYEVSKKANPLPANAQFEKVRSQFYKIARTKPEYSKTSPTKEKPSPKSYSLQPTRSGSILFDENLQNDKSAEFIQKLEDFHSKISGLDSKNINKELAEILTFGKKILPQGKLGEGADRLPNKAPQRRPEQIDKQIEALNKQISKYVAECKRDPEFFSKVGFKNILENIGNFIGGKDLVENHVLVVRELPVPLAQDLQNKSPRAR